MTETTATPPAGSTVTDQPIYWFCILEDAMDRGDHQAAAEAQRELARLGVRVAFGRPTARRREVASHG
jgi:hypothetical protein